jgi:YVTN family beta-propeller protein
MEELYDSIKRKSPVMILMLNVLLSMLFTSSYWLMQSLTYLQNAKPLSTALLKSIHDITPSAFAMSDASITGTLNENQLDQSVPASAGLMVGVKPTGIAVNPTTNLVYVIFSLFNKVVVIDFTKDKAVASIQVGKFPSSIAVDPNTNMVYVANNRENTVSVIEGFTNKVVANVSVGDRPLNIAVNPERHLLYVTLQKSGSVVVIDTDANEVYNYKCCRYKIGGNYSAIAVNPYRDDVYITRHNFSELPAVTVLEGQFPHFPKTTVITNDTLLDIAINPNTNRIYALGIDGIVYIIDGYNNEKAVATIQVGKFPSSIAVDPNTNMVYVANNRENTVSVIEGFTNNFTHKIVTDIKIDTANGNPAFLESRTRLSINPITHMVYVVNQDSGFVSVIDGKTNKVLVGASFYVTPANSGFVRCNEQNLINNHTTYPVNTQLRCKSYANGGFAFSAWSGDFLPLDSDNSGTVPQSTISHNLFNFLTSNQNSNPNKNPEAVFQLSHYGNLTANFIQPNQVSLPPEFWTPLYGLIPGFFIPSVISWLNGKRQRKYFGECLDKIGKLDKKVLERDITNLYREGKISESHYDMLKEKISEYYSN